MKKYLYILLISVFCVGMITIYIQQKTIKTVRSDRDRLAVNQNTLMIGLDTFRTKDNLSAAKIRTLTLSLGEFKRYHSGDIESIKSLNADVRRLRSLMNVGTQTVYNVSTVFRDSIISKDSIIKCVDYDSEWLTFVGCIDSLNNFKGSIQSREKLSIIEHIIPKRFLGFLWKYGCKERRREIISKNPHTKITDVEYIEIK